MGVGVYECRMLNGERKYERTKGTAHTGKILIELNEQGCVSAHITSPSLAAPKIS